jgi:hypothetical protein
MQRLAAEAGRGAAIVPRPDLPSPAAAIVLEAWLHRTTTRARTLTIQGRPRKEMSRSKLRLADVVRFYSLSSRRSF